MLVVPIVRGVVELGWLPSSPLTSTSLFVMKTPTLPLARAVVPQGGCGGSGSVVRRIIDPDCSLCSEVSCRSSPLGS